jgi:hypothetical protein
MKPKHPDIAFLMFKLDAELAEMNAVQGRVTDLKDRIWEMMRDANLSHVCYDGRFTASARGKSLVVGHRAQSEDVER